MCAWRQIAAVSKKKAQILKKLDNGATISPRRGVVWPVRSDYLRTITVHPNPYHLPEETSWQPQRK